MRRYRKKELLDMAVSLEESNGIIGTGRGLNQSDALNILAQCQEAALAIGNSPELQGEEGIFIIKLLEGYCEDIYQMSLALGNENQCRKISKKIRKGLLALKHGIEYDLPDDRKVVVFLPYQPSMWDSFESIWKKTVEDETCEVYVVPIPYYDRKPDGTFGQMHCDDTGYPKEVKLTSWKHFSISDIRPDVIYIHNPYDECNTITSVHPAFYARELKKYTEELIYIPYFIGVNNKVSEELCVLPGTIFADKVILQSQEVRKAYIDRYRRWENAQKCRDVFGKAEEKFLALGSPKVDKVLSVKREDFEIPSEWSRLINRQDGTARKVILYNTSIAIMLKDSEKMLAKIRNVLRLFRRQDDLVLLWRPHPLLRATLQSMRAKYVQEYDAIVKAYQEEGWGIYDDSADLYRAIAVSDAYYGDCSSVVELYKYTGKLIMIQDTNVVADVVASDLC